MNFTYEEFLNKIFVIHVDSFEQVEEIRKYYPHEETTLSELNWEIYPYVFFEHSGIHGAQSGVFENVISFEEWRRIITEQDDCSLEELEESEYDISFLFSNPV